MGFIAAGIEASAQTAIAIWEMQAARKEAQRNRNFQERLSNTAHQRETLDLERAGLNRILGYSRGGHGASTPSGASASSISKAGNIAGGAIATAMAVKKNKAEVNNLDMQAAAARTQSQLNGEKTTSEMHQNVYRRQKAELLLGAEGSARGALGRYRNLQDMRRRFTDDYWGNYFKNHPEGK